MLYSSQRFCFKFKWPILDTCTYLTAVSLTFKTRNEIVRHVSCNHPAGTQHQNDVVSTSMRRDHVASTLIRRHFNVVCPLGSFHLLEDADKDLVIGHGRCKGKLYPDDFLLLYSQQLQNYSMLLKSTAKLPELYILTKSGNKGIKHFRNRQTIWNYSLELLSRNPRDSLKHFEMSIHIRFAKLRKKK